MKGKKMIKKVFGAVCILSVSSFGYLSFEPEITDAAADSVAVNQAVTSEITISSPADVTMSGSIPGMSGGSATGSATWTVKTNDTSGFNMKINSDAVDCLRNGTNHFNDYVPTVAGTPDYNWASPAASGFGFTVEPATATDTDQKFKDNGSACNIGSGNVADRCWYGFNSTTQITIINRTTQTTSAGEAEVVKFRSELAAGQFLIENIYSATITVTAVTN